MGALGLACTSAAAQTTHAVHIPCPGTMPTGIYAEIIVPDSARFGHCGAPVVVFCHGGWEGEGLSGGEGLPGEGFIFISFNYPGSGPVSKRSGGIYDDRGMNCLRALRQVILFANGDEPDMLGNYLSDYADMDSITVAEDNLGLMGSSNGGNATLAVLGVYAGDTLPVNWVANWESPVGDGMPTVLCGAVKPSKPYPNPSPNPAYDYTTGGWDFSTLRYSDTLISATMGSVGPTKKLRGAFYFDFDGDSVPDVGSDYMVGGTPFTLPSGDTLVGIPEFLVDSAIARGVYPVPPLPNYIPTPNQNHNFWAIRNGAYFFDTIADVLPDLLFMSLASLIDHVQGSPDYPHILAQINGLDAVGLWTRLNPDSLYMATLSGMTLSGTPDNDALQTYDYASIGAAVVPEGYSKPKLVQAGCAELADRVFDGDLAVQRTAFGSLCPGFKTLGMFEPTTSHTYMIFPNPTKEAWQVIMPDATGEVKYRLFDLQGKLMRKGEIGTIGSVSAEHLADGMYLLELSYEGKTEMIRVSVE